MIELALWRRHRLGVKSPPSRTRVVEEPSGPVRLVVGLRVRQATGEVASSSEALVECDNGFGGSVAPGRPAGLY